MSKIIKLIDFTPKQIKNGIQDFPQIVAMGICQNCHHEVSVLKGSDGQLIIESHHYSNNNQEKCDYSGKIIDSSSLTPVAA